MNRRTVLKTGTAALGFAATSTPILAATTHDITIKKFKFDPDTITVSVGDTIRWTNKDGAPHTATAKNEGWDTGRLNKKQTSDAITVTADMDTDYFCRFHPNMKAKLIIKG